MLCFLLLLVLVLLVAGVSAVGGLSLESVRDAKVWKQHTNGPLSVWYSESCCANSAKELPSNLIRISCCSWHMFSCFDCMRGKTFEGVADWKLLREQVSKPMGSCHFLHHCDLSQKV